MRVDFNCFEVQKTEMKAKIFCLQEHDHQEPIEGHY